MTFNLEKIMRLSKPEGLTMIMISMHSSQFQFEFVRWRGDYPHD